MIRKRITPMVLHGKLSPRAYEITLQLENVANRAVASNAATRKLVYKAANTPIRLVNRDVNDGEKKTQNIGCFLGNAIDAAFKELARQELRAGRLLPNQDKERQDILRILPSARDKGASPAEKKGPDIVLDDVIAHERVAWDMTSTKEIARHFRRDVQGKEESWDAYILFVHD